MVARAALVAAGWTIDEIAAGCIRPGTVGGWAEGGYADGIDGWHFVLAERAIVYPKELGSELFIGNGVEAAGTLIRFVTDRGAANSELIVGFEGLFSSSDEPVLGFSDGECPGIPGNRFIEVAFNQRGDERSTGLLRCRLLVNDHIHGSAEEPSLAICVVGHSRLTKLGSRPFGFVVYLSTHGTVHLGSVHTQEQGISVHQAGNQIDVRLRMSAPSGLGLH